MAAVHDHPDLRGARAHPASLLEASADLGARSLRTFCRVVLPLAFPQSSPARSSLSRSRSATTSARRSSRAAVHRQRHLRQHRRGEQPPVRGRVRDRADPLVAVMTVYLFGEATRGVREPLMMDESRNTLVSCASATACDLAFIYFPLVIIALYAFNANISQTWPIEELHDEVVLCRLARRRRPGALLLSVKAALLATASRSFSGRCSRSRCRDSRSSGRTRSRSSSSSRSRCRGSSPGIALNATINDRASTARGQLRVWRRSSSGTRRSASSSSTTT